MTDRTATGCDLHEGLSSDVKDIRNNIVGRWTFMIIMGIFLGMTGFLWVEMRNINSNVSTLRSEFNVEIKSSLSNSEEKRDQILYRMNSLSDQVSQLKGALDAHMLMNKGK